MVLVRFWTDLRWHRLHTSWHENLLCRSRVITWQHVVRRITGRWLHDLSWKTPHTDGQNVAIMCSSLALKRKEQLKIWQACMWKRLLSKKYTTGDVYNVKVWRTIKRRNNVRSEKRKQSWREVKHSTCYAKDRMSQQFWKLKTTSLHFVSLEGCCCCCCPSEANGAQMRSALHWAIFKKTRWFLPFIFTKNVMYRHSVGGRDIVRRLAFKFGGGILVLVYFSFL
jgi:hypothetical protein